MLLRVLDEWLDVLVFRVYQSGHPLLTLKYVQISLKVFSFFAHKTCLLKSINLAHMFEDWLIFIIANANLRNYPAACHLIRVIRASESNQIATLPLFTGS